MKNYIYHTVEQGPDVLEQYLKERLGYSGRRLQKLTRQKGLLLNGKAAYLQRKVKSGDTIGILQMEDFSYGVVPEHGSVEILYEDEAMLVLNKPPRQLVHPAGQTSSGTLANYLAGLWESRGLLQKIRPLHRLDRDTSGCVIFAKDEKSQMVLERQMKEKKLSRQYLALVQGTPEVEAGRIEVPIGRHPHQPNRRSISEKGDAACTIYQVVEKYSEAALLQLILETGRTHQIRLHLAHIGLPILGDGMYGVRSPWIRRQALHAGEISFCRLKDGEKITVLAPLPEDFLRAQHFFRQEKEKMQAEISHI